MVTSNKDAAKIWAEIEKAKNSSKTESVDPYYDAGPFAQDLEHHPGARGPADLEQRIEDLQRIERMHRKMNGELRKEVYDLKLKAAKADEYKTTIEQMKSIISDLTRENNRLSKNELNTTQVLKEFRNKGDV